MKTHFLTERVWAVTIIILTLGNLNAHAAVCDWTNTSGGNWSNTNNWSPKRVPGPADTANITIAGNYSVTLDADPAVAGLILGASKGGTTQNLLVSGHALSINGPIQVSSQGQFNLNGGVLSGTNVLTGTLTWSGGNLSGSLTLASNSVLNIVAGGGYGFDGLVLTNYGTVNWTNATLYGINRRNAQIYNYGLWNAQSDHPFYGGYGGGSSIFNNFGTFLKSGGQGITALDGNVVFNNTGTVTARSGKLNLQGGGTSSGGQFATATGAFINFSSYSFANSNTFAGTGNFVASGASFNGTIAGTLNWNGGNLSGNLSLPSNSVLNIVAGGGYGFDGLVLTNYGTVNWTNAVLYGINGHNAQIYNYGLWNAQSDHPFYGGYGGGSTLFNNFGTFVKSGGTSITTLDSGVVFNNTGRVDIQSGALNIGAGASSGGVFTTASGTSLAFISTVYHFTNATFGGVGGVVSAGASFAGTVDGMLSWNGGNLSGSLTLASNSVLNIVAGGGYGFDGLALTNYGTVNWTNAVLYGINQRNAQIYNYGLWNAQSDHPFYGGYGGGSTLFNNYGTFLKSGGTNVTTLDSGVVFNNTGTVNVRSGTLEIKGGGVNSGSGTFGTANGALLGLDNMTFANSATISSATAVDLGGNTIINGTLTATNLELVGGTLGGTNVLKGTLTWSGGSLSGNLTVASNSVLNIVAGGGNGFKDLTLTNLGTVNWTNATIYGRGTNITQIYNCGLWNAQSDNDFYGGYDGGSTLFNNSGTFLKSGGPGNTALNGSVVFNNTGTVNARNGKLNLQGGGTSSSGYFATATGAFINFSSYSFANSNTFAGVGNIVASGASFDGAIAGMLNWDGGSLSGNLTLASNSVLNIVAGGGYGFDGLVLTNYGTVNWTNATLYGVNRRNAQIYNYGLWNAQSDHPFYGGYGGGSTLFNNFGTFLKSGGTNITTLDSGVVFNNTGTVDVQTGTQDIGAGASSGGVFTTASGASLVFISTVYHFTNATFDGVGGVVSAGASFGGTIDGTLSWRGGSLSGNLTLASNSVLNVVAGGGYGFDGLALTNYGTVNWTNAALYGVNKHNAQIYNYGLWNAQSDQPFYGGYGGGSTLFNNFGTFLKSGGMNVTTLDSGVVFNNTGMVDLESGTLSLNGNYNLTGGTLNFGINSQTAFGSLAFSGAAILTGSDSVTFNNNFVPAPGSRFQLLKYASLSGSFNSANLPVGLSFTYSKTSATLVWDGITAADWAAGDSALHGTSSATFLNSPGTSVQLMAWSGGVSHALGATVSSGISTVSFNTAQLPDGLYTLQAIVRNAAGQSTGEYSRTVFINNSLTWHEGMLSDSQTWGKNTVNAVDRDVIIPSGVTLAIAPGAIVKFARGAGIVIQSGGTLDTSAATAGEPIIFTSMADDAAGGDSNEDGDSSIPVPGDWNGITDAGEFKKSPYLALRYAIEMHSGTLSASQEWAASVEHLVKGNVTVPSGVTLTIDPGAIVKFAPGLNLTVKSNGTLNAIGTISQPIVFTSINDESVGARANAFPATPAAGDWDSIYVQGGHATFDHVAISYGGGPDPMNSGLVSTIGPGSEVSISDSTLAQGFYRGVEAGYGIVNLTNCVITGCDRGVQSGMYGPTVVNIVNCTLDNNNFGLFAHGGVLNVVNSIIADSLTAGIAYCCGSSMTTFTHNNVWSATGTYGSTTWPFANQTGRNGNISANPRFVNAAQGNFQLDFGSPCIDAADGSVAPSADRTGAPRYDDPAALTKTGIPDANRLHPDIGAYEFVQTAGSTIDLVANSVSGPLSVVAGQTATVCWTDVNLGVDSATGPWHDTISLIPDGGGAPIVAGVVLVGQNLTLGPGRNGAMSASVVVPAGLQGNYNWQVQVNSQGDVFEGVNSSNNFSRQSTLTSLTDTPLDIDGTSAHGVFTGAGQSRVFALSLAPGQNVLVTAQGGGGLVIQLYAANGYVPTPSSFDVESSQFSSSSASVVVGSAAGGTYYVVAYAQSLNAGGAGFTIAATAAKFTLGSVLPAQMANNGPVTLQINGDQLDATDTYQLLGAGGKFAGTAALGSDPAVAFVTFNLGGAQPGPYSLIVLKPDGQSLTLPNAVTAVSLSDAPAAPAFSVQLQLPAMVRVGRPFNGAIVYGNTGGADMPAPLLILSSGGKAGLALPGSTNYSTSDQVLIAASFSGPAGILRAGQNWSIPFQALNSSDAPATFSVNYKLSCATDAVNYASLKTSFRPADGYSDAQWNALWTNFVAQAGPTWGGFVSRMAHYATLMAADDPSSLFYSLQDVLAFAFQDSLAQAESTASGTLYLNSTNAPLALTTMTIYSIDQSATVSLTTAPDGTFRAGKLPPGTYNVAVRSYLDPTPVQFTVPASGSLSGLAIVVTSGGSIQGSVQSSETGTYLGNVVVVATSASDQAIFTTVTESNGSYVLEGLPPDTYNLSVGGSPYDTQYNPGLSIGAGQALTGLNFTLRTAGAINGTLVSGGNKVNNAAITLTAASGVKVATSSDSSGNFYLGGLSAGQYTITAQAPGLAAFISQVTLAAGATNNLGTITLTTGATLKVVVQSADGTAVTNGTVFLAQSDGSRDFDLLAASGQVVFTGVSLGACILDVQAPGYLEQKLACTASSTTIKVTLMTGGVIQGIVTDGENAGIPNMEINFHGSALPDGYPTTLASTLTNGTYKVSNLPLGTYVMSVGNNGGLLRQTITIDAAHMVQTVNFQLGGASIGGTILQGDGQTPAANATVFLMQGDDLLLSATTDATGAYRIRSVAAGFYTLQAGQPGGITPPVNIIVAGEGLTTAPTLSFGSLSVTGKVTDTNGNAVSDALVALTPGPVANLAQFCIASTDASGAFSVAGLPPGQYRASIGADRFALLRSTLTLSNSASPAFILNGGVSVDGLITFAANGHGVAQALLNFLDPISHLSMGTAITAANGAYQLPHLQPGDYDLIIREPDLVQISQQRLTISGPTHLNVAMAAQNTSLRGTVKDSSGTPLPGAWVGISDSAGKPLGTYSTDDKGAWSATELAPGSYGATVRLAGFHPMRYSSVALSAGAPVQQSTALASAGTDDYLQNVADSVPYFGQKALDYYKQQNPTPEKDVMSDLTMPPLKPGDCPEAQQAYYDCWVARDNMNSAFERWESHSANFDGTLKYSAAIFAADYAALVGSVIAMVEGGGATTLYQELSTADKVIYNSTTIAAPFIQNVYKICSGWAGNMANLQSGGPSEVVGSVHSLVNQLRGAVVPGFTVAKMLKEIDEVPAWMKVANPALQGIKTLYDSANSMDAVLGLGDSVVQARDEYTRACAKYRQRRNQLLAANGDPCPRPKPPKPPLPPPPNDPVNGPKDTPDTGRSADPNDKLATGFGLPGWIGSGQPITYTIEFENESTAELPAQTVTITDQLAANLDWSTLQLTGIGFNNTVIPIPGGVQTFITNAGVATDPNPVLVTASLNPTNGVVTWYIQSTDTATGQIVSNPMAGFLPPNNAQRQGEGFVTYTIQARNGLPTGAKITNQAIVVFDVNAPIVTPFVTNTVDVTAPTSAVAALPANSPAAFTVSWSGQDTGSGVADFDIYVSTNGGAWTLWLPGTTSTSARFNGAMNNTYAFASIASDAVGNREASPVFPAAQTTVLGKPTVVTSPTNVTAKAGTTVTLAAASAGDVGVSYQWLFNGNALKDSAKFSGANTEVLMISNVLRADNGSYKLLLSNKLGVVNTASAVLSVLDPAINIQPSNTAVVVGRSATLMVGAGGTPNLAYQWYSAANGSAARLNGQTNSSLVLANVSPAAAGNYFAIVSNQLPAPNTATSAVATVTVLTPPVITNQPPASITAIAGNNVVFATEATGGLLTYQWTLNTEPIEGATSNTLVLKNVQSRNAGRYRCIVSNSAGTATTSPTSGLLVVSPDSTQPQLAIGSPPANAQITTPTITLTGTATDAGAIANVVVRQIFPPDTNACSLAILSGANPGQQSWSDTLPLVPGTNTFAVYACNSAGIVSATNIRSFYRATAVLAVGVNGNGSTKAAGSPAHGAATNGANLLIGQSYQITAVPGPNTLFDTWKDGSGLTLTNGSQLSFVMKTNLTLQACFTTNVFLAAQGTYNGLFAPAGAPRQQTNSGAITFTVTKSGVLSGKLIIGNNMASLSGKFAPSGAATITTLRKGLRPLTTTLQLNFADQSVQGTVGDGAFLSQLLGDQVVFSSTHKATDYAGQYTLIIPGASDAKTGPFGVSYQTVTVAASGSIAFTGSLADGTPVSPMKSVLSKDGYWPFYVPLYGGKGSLWGWNYFANRGIVAAPSASWINTANSTKGAAYRSGFTNQQAGIIGSLYNTAKKPLLGLTNAQVIVKGGGLPSALTNQIAWTSKNTIAVPPNTKNTNGLTLAINPATGLITGSFQNPANKKQIIKIQGVLLQNQTNASGYFLGTNQSGTFTLDPP